LFDFVHHALFTRGGDDDDGNGMKNGGNKSPKYYWADEDGSSTSHTKGPPGMSEHHHKRHRKHAPTPAPTQAPDLPWWLKLLYRIVGGVIGALLLGMFWGVDKVVAFWRGRVFNHQSAASGTMLGSESEDEEDELITEDLKTHNIEENVLVGIAVNTLPQNSDTNLCESLSSANNDSDGAAVIQPELEDFSFKPPS
jgi:hypothetical protein